MGDTTDGHREARHSQEDERAISALIEQLRDPNGLKRQAARQQLIDIGPSAVPALIPLLSDRTEQTRWEAAKALTELPDPRAAEPLTALMRESDSIRWLAGTALTNIGEPSFAPVVRALLAHPDSPRVRDVAARVLRDLKRQHPDHPYAQTMLDALQGQAQAETIPWVARSILKQMGLIQADEG